MNKWFMILVIELSASNDYEFAVGNCHLYFL